MEGYAVTYDIELKMIGTMMFLVGINIIIGWGV